MFSPPACFLVSKFPNITYQEVRKKERMEDKKEEWKEGRKEE
jgi:hypothetical protein